MYLINEITDEPNQNHTLSIPNGAEIKISFTYKENQRGWFMSFTYVGRSFANRRIVTSPNMMRQFKDIIPFGFACIVEGGGEPILKNDFFTTRAKFYLLDETDVQSVEDNIINV